MCMLPQHTATHCDTLQHTATHTVTWLSIAVRCSVALWGGSGICVCSSNTLQPSTSRYHTLQHTVNTATHSNVWSHSVVNCGWVQLSFMGWRLHVCMLVQHSATHCDTLQHTATHCNTLQHTATHRDIQGSPGCPLQRGATHCNTLQHTATHCNTLQHTTTHCNTLQHTATYKGHLDVHCSRVHLSFIGWRGHVCMLPQHTATRCSTVQHGATHCNTLQLTATQCNTRQHTSHLVVDCSGVQLSFLGWRWHIFTAPRMHNVE